MQASPRARQRQVTRERFRSSILQLLTTMMHEQHEITLISPTSEGVQHTNLQHPDGDDTTKAGCQGRPAAGPTACMLPATRAAPDTLATAATPSDRRSRPTPTRCCCHRRGDDVRHRPEGAAGLRQGRGGVQCADARHHVHCAFADVCLSVRARIPDVAVWCHPQRKPTASRTYALPMLT